MRRISPRFVVRREYASVHANQQVVVGRVENAVSAVKVARHVDDVDGFVHGVVHSEILYAVIDIVLSVVVEGVRDYRVFERLGSAFCRLERSLEVGTRTLHPCRNEHKRHGAALRSLVAQLVDSLDKHIETLVAELVTSRSGNQERVTFIRFARKAFSHVEQLRASSLAAVVVGGSVRHKVAFETVGSHHSLALEQLHAFASRRLAHRRKAVCRMSCRLFERMFRLHVEFSRHLVAVVAGEIVVERLVVAADAATDACCVGCKYGGDARSVSVEVEKSHARRPFVEVCHDMVAAACNRCSATVDDHRCSHAESATFVVVAVCVERIYAVFLPHLLIYFVFYAVDAVKFDENGNRVARHVPATNSDADALGQVCSAHPFFENCFRFFEER